MRLSEVLLIIMLLLLLRHAANILLLEDFNTKYRYRPVRKCRDPTYVQLPSTQLSVQDSVIHLENDKEDIYRPTSKCHTKKFLTSTMCNINDNQ